MRTSAVSCILFGAATGEAAGDSATSLTPATAQEHSTKIGRHKSELQKEKKRLTVYTRENRFFFLEIQSLCVFIYP
jgi:hypothetical protein